MKKTSLNAFFIKISNSFKLFKNEIFESNINLITLIACGIMFATLL